MIDLQRDAEEYFIDNIYCDGITLFEEEISKKCFIAGATSKYVEIEKIKFAIEQLYKFRECTFGKGVNVIKELEQQLKQIEK